MTILEHASVFSQQDDVTTRPNKPPISTLLKSLRGDKSLRQVERDTGISNAYLCNIELGLRQPGIKTLTKLAQYHQVPLVQVTAMPFDHVEPPASILDVQRSYDYILADPVLHQYQKPAGMPAMDYQRFVVQLYQHSPARDYPTRSSLAQDIELSLQFGSA